MASLSEEIDKDTSLSISGLADFYGQADVFSYLNHAYS